MRGFSRVLLLVTALTSFLAASPVLAQTTPAGIVTAVHGTATIARAANSQTGPLRFKDDVFLNDRVTTGERSLARILLGGKAVVTARERSTLTITAVPGAATLDLERGRLLLAVAKSAMRPGESIDIKTRNAIIGIRGTVVVADFTPGEARDGSGDATVFTILRGAVEVTQIDPLAARSVGAPLRLGALQSVKLMGTRIPEVNTISAEQAKRITQGFAVPIRLTPETSKEVARVHAAQVAEELTALLPTSTSSNCDTTASTSCSLLTTTTGTLTTTTGTLLTPTSGTLSTTSGGLTSTVQSTSGSLLNTTGSLLGTTTDALLKTTGSLLK